MSNRRLAYGLAYTVAATSAVLASCYGFMSATGYYGIAKGAGLCLVAIIGCHGLAWTAQLKRALGLPAALFGGLVTLACFAVTLAGGIGTVTSGTAALSAGQAKAASDVKRAAGELARLRAERTALTFRPTDAAGVQAARDAVDTAARNREAECKVRGSNCRKREADEAAARGALAAALGDHAATERAARLDEQLATLRSQLDAAEPVAATLDPQASAFSQLTGLPVDTAAALYAFAFSVALELAAMLAMLVAHSYPVAPVPVPGRLVSVAVRADVARFMIARVSRSPDSATEARQIYLAFVEWCHGEGLAPMDPLAFAGDLKALCERGRIAISHDGERAWCQGVALIA